MMRLAPVLALAPVFVLAGALVFGSVTPSRADADVAPFEAMRSLQALQDRIATGDAVAQAAHAKAILRTAHTFTSAKTSIWRDKRNARALIAYLFSGGSASAIEHSIPSDLIEPDLKPLYEGALAYGLGDDETARARLMTIDAKTMPSGLGGHLALVQATLVAAEDAPKAITLLDVARLLEPGTLVEEAALRKEMSLIGSSGDLEKFALLARRYLNGFPHSIYGENFRHLVAQAAMQLGAGDSSEAGAKVDKLVGSLDRDERRRLYLAIAREALVSGRVTMAAFAGTEAGRLAGRDDPDAARAMVYVGAATIVGPKYEQGLKALDEVSPSRLDARDRAIRTSAIAVADLIRKAPTSAQGAEMQGQAQAAILADGERSLAAADIFLKDAQK